MAPEIYDKNSFISSKCDIYSIVMMIYYIIMEEYPEKINDCQQKYPIIYEIYKKCTNLDPYKRPTSSI